MSSIQVASKICDSSVFRCKVTDEKLLMKSLEKALVEELYNGPTLEAIAEKYCVSPRTLSRRLNNIGICFRTVLGEVRVKESINLLSDPAMKISEIGRKLGYRDASNYTKAFKRLTGCTPIEFRKGRCC